MGFRGVQNALAVHLKVWHGPLAGAKGMGTRPLQQDCARARVALGAPLNHRLGKVLKAVHEGHAAAALVQPMPRPLRTAPPCLGFTGC